MFVIDQAMESPIVESEGVECEQERDYNMERSYESIHYWMGIVDLIGYYMYDDEVIARSPYKFEVTASEVLSSIRLGLWNWIDTRVLSCLFSEVAVSSRT